MASFDVIMLPVFRSYEMVELGGGGIRSKAVRDLFTLADYRYRPADSSLGTPAVWTPTMSPPARSPPVCRWRRTGRWRNCRRARSLAGHQRPPGTGARGTEAGAPGLEAQPPVGRSVPRSHRHDGRARADRTAVQSFSSPVTAYRPGSGETTAGYAG